MNVVDRFLEYVKFDTQSDELTNLTPSTPGQMVFAQYLEEKLKEFIGHTPLQVLIGGILGIIVAIVVGNIM